MLALTLLLVASDPADVAPIANADANANAAVAQSDANAVGLPTAFSRREPTLKQWQWEGSAHLGLVGTGSTRIADELRFAPLDWLELRTAFLPHPSSLMARVGIGRDADRFRAPVVDG